MVSVQAEYTFLYERNAPLNLGSQYNSAYVALMPDTCSVQNIAPSTIVAIGFGVSCHRILLFGFDRRLAPSPKKIDWRAGSKRGLMWKGSFRATEGG